MIIALDTCNRRTFRSVSAEKNAAVQPWRNDDTEMWRRVELNVVGLVSCMPPKSVATKRNQKCRSGNPEYVMPY